MSSSPARLDDLQQKFTEQPRRYFAPLADALRQAGDVEAAVELCRGYLAEIPDHLAGHVVLALALRDRGESDAARAEFERVLALDAENVLALNALGELACRRGDERDAQHWYERLVTADPHDPDAVARLAALREGAATTTEAPARGGREQAFEAEVFTAGFVAAVLDEPPAPPATPTHDFAPPEAEQRPGESDASVVDGSETSATQGAADDAADFGELDVERELAALTPEFEDASLVPEHDAASLGEPVAGDEPSAEEIDRLFAELPDFPPLGTSAAPPSLPPLAAFDDTTSLIATGALADDEPPSERQPEPDAEAEPEAELRPETEFQPEPASETGAEIAPETEAGPEMASESERATESEAMAPVDEGEPRVAFVTETMAELYLQQGFHAEARHVYEQLLAQRPENDALRARLDELSATASEPAGDAHDEPPMAWDDAVRGLADLELPEVSAEASAEPDEQATVGEREDAGEPADIEASTVAESSPAESSPTVADWLRTLTQARPAAAAADATEAAATTPEEAPPAAGEMPAAEQAPAPESDESDALTDAVAFSESAIVVREIEAAAAPEREEEPSPVEAEESASTVAWVEAQPTDGADVLSSDELETSADDSAASDQAEVEAHELEAHEVEAPAAQATTDAEPPAEEDPFGWDDLLGAAPAVGAATPHVAAAELDEASHDELVASNDWYEALPTEADDEPATAEPAAPDERAADAADALSLDELFAQPVAPTAETAAGTLVAATLSLQNDRELDAQLSQAASDDPGSIEHVLRTPTQVAPARPTPTFSFEQFFTPALGSPAAPEKPHATPARNAPASEAAPGDDLDEFHAWLAGLSDS